MTLDGERLERFLEACGVLGDDIPATVARARAVAAESETAVLQIEIGPDGVAAVEVQSAGVPTLVAG